MDDTVPDEVLLKRIQRIRGELSTVEDIAKVRGWMLPASHIDDSLKDLDECIAAVKTVAIPDDEINARYRSRMNNEYIRTRTGTKFWPYDPKPEEVFLEDIASGLSQSGRYAGQLRRMVSIVEHSIKVGAICEHLAQEAVARRDIGAHLVPFAALMGLLHDAHEGYMGDMPAPMERRLTDVYGVEWRILKQNLQDVIHEALELPAIPPEIESIVAEADAYSRFGEVTRLHHPDCTIEEFGCKTPPEGVIPLARVSEEPQDVGKLMGLWLAEAKRLINLVGGRIPRRVEVKDEEPRHVHVDMAVGEDKVSKILSNISEGSWRDHVAPSEVYIPEALRDEPEFNDGQ